MIITMGIVMDLDLSLNSEEMVQKLREKNELYKESKKKLKTFQKKYGYTSKRVCAAESLYCCTYDSEIFKKIPPKERLEWRKCCRTVVTASFAYRFWVCFLEIMGLNMYD